MVSIYPVQPDTSLYYYVGDTQSLKLKMNISLLLEVAGFSSQTHKCAHVLSETVFGVYCTGQVSLTWVTWHRHSQQALRPVLNNPNICTPESFQVIFLFQIIIIIIFLNPPPTAFSAEMKGF